MTFFDVTGALAGLLQLLNVSMPPACEEGTWDPDTGLWDDAMPVQTQIRAAVLPLTAEELRFLETGTYSTQDVQLFCTQKLPMQTRFIYNGEQYAVDHIEDYLQTGGYVRYIAKRQMQG